MNSHAGWTMPKQVYTMFKETNPSSQSSRLGKCQIAVTDSKWLHLEVLSVLYLPCLWLMTSSSWRGTRLLVGQVYIPLPWDQWASTAGFFLSSVSAQRPYWSPYSTQSSSRFPAPSQLQLIQWAHFSFLWLLLSIINLYFIRSSLFVSL